jgi:hypothetical protein
MLNLKKCVSAIAKLVPAVAISATALIVASCGGGGGGGVTGENNSGLVAGPLSINPGAANLYANVPVSITIAGGTRPYLLSTNEPTVFPGINGFSTRNNQITLVPAQPAVVDPSSDPNIVPSRSASINVRDASGVTAVGTYSVLVNPALTYGITITNLNPGLAEQTCGNPINVCSGQEAVVTMRSSLAGIARPGRVIRLDAIQGDYDFVSLDAGASLVKTQSITSDSTGQIITKIRARASSPTQIAVLRVTDVASNATRDEVFTIASAVSGAGIITAIPSNVGVTGPNSTACATGAAFDIYVYGGRAPYTVRNPWTDILTVTGAPVINNGGRFTVTTTGRVCTQAAGVNLIIVDATGREITITIINTVGTGAPAAPFVISPDSLALVGCGSGVLTIASEVGVPFVSLSNPSFTASQALPVAGFPGLYTLTISRVAECTSGVLASPVSPNNAGCVPGAAVATFVGGSSISRVNVTGTCPAAAAGPPASISLQTLPVQVNGCSQTPVSFIGQNLTSFPLATLSTQFAALGFQVSPVTTGSSSGSLVFTITPTNACAANVPACVPALIADAIEITAQAGAAGSPGRLAVNRTCNP